LTRRFGDSALKVDRRDAASYRFVRLDKPISMGTPAYQRIADDIAARIRSGELRPSDRLPPEQDLAEQYGVARMTMRQAISRLVDGALVVRQQGVGTFVAKEPAARRSLNRLTGFSEDMQASGQRFKTEILAQMAENPPPDIAGELELDEGARVVVVKRRRLIEGKPASLHYSYLPFGLYPSLAREPLLGGSLYRTLEQTFNTKLRRADQRLRAVALGREEARRLDVRAGTPALRTERLTYDDRNMRVEFARSWTLPPFELIVHLER
jgi:GntR family transcriptional regulator